MDVGVGHNLLHEKVNKIISKPVSSPETHVNTVQRQQVRLGNWHSMVLNPLPL